MTKNLELYLIIGGIFADSNNKKLTEDEIQSQIDFNIQNYQQKMNDFCSENKTGILGHNIKIFTEFFQ